MPKLSRLQSHAVVLTIHLQRENCGLKLLEIDGIVLSVYSNLLSIFPFEHVRTSADACKVIPHERLIPSNGWIPIASTSTSIPTNYPSVGAREKLPPFSTQQSTLNSLRRRELNGHRDSENRVESTFPQKKCHTFHARNSDVPSHRGKTGSLSQHQRVRTLEALSSCARSLLLAFATTRPASTRADRSGLLFPSLPRIQNPPAPPDRGPADTV